MNLICPYCGATPGIRCRVMTSGFYDMVDKPHKTRVTAVKKGAS